MSSETNETQEKLPESTNVGNVKTSDYNFSEELKKANAEALKWRLRAKENKEATAKVALIEEELKSTQDTAQRALSQAQEMNRVAETRMISAELRALSSEFGLKDMQYVKIADQSGIKIDQSGNVIGAREMMESLKKNHPDLFGNMTTTNPKFISTETSDVPSEKPMLRASKKEFEEAERNFLRSLR